jgi:hypothetical protein
MLPEVESPIPKTIGIGAIFEIAAAGGIVGLVVATALGASDRERWAANGVVLAFFFRSCIYLVSLLNQLI